LGWNSFDIVTLGYHTSLETIPVTRQQEWLQNIVQKYEYTQAFVIQLARMCCYISDFQDYWKLLDIQ